MENKLEEREPLYKVGDRVVYIDYNKTEKTGTITKIEVTDVYDWNKDKEQKFIYLITTSLYLRYEDEILGLCE